MRAYSQDLRDRVLDALGRGERPAQIAKRLEVSRGWVRQVRNRFEQQGKRTSLPMGGHRKSRVAPLEAVLRSWIEAKPDLTLAEMCARLAAEHGVAIKIPALWHQLDKWGLRFKKNPARQRARAPGRAGGAGGLEARSSRARRRKARLS